MKYFIISLVIIFNILFVYYFFRKRWAKKRVKMSSTEEKISYINAFLNPFGFEYLKDQDIIISKENSWQRGLGFHDIYDYKAPFFYMVMHSEPIYFDYNNKNYRIEFWKGQYGITTGAEIGVYVRDCDSNLPLGFYRCANEDEIFDMSFTLYKKCQLFHRCGCTWWLTGFDVGTFSKPKDLSMNICIKFLCSEMQEAFLKGLYESGYTQNNINVCCDSVCIDYCYPKNYKLNHKYKLIRLFSQIINYFNCKLYKFYTRDFNTTLDRLTYIRFMLPFVFQRILKNIVKRKKQQEILEKKMHKKGTKKN